MFKPFIKADNAFNEKKGDISVIFKKEAKEENYILVIEDNGKGFDFQMKEYKNE